MFSIRSCELPEGALLSAFRLDGKYTDCYATDVAGPISHAQFVSAFYTTFVFKLERSILAWAVSKPSTDAQAGQLANGSIEEFAAWRVEKRCPDQLLLSDFRGRTRSWLMVSPIATGTRLYFGSAVVPARDRTTGRNKPGVVFTALLGFHKLYSIMLLRAAKARLKALEGNSSV